MNAVATIQFPALAEGEYHAGIILKDDGTPDYFLIGLPGDLESATWKQALDWAKNAGGKLPTRRELSLSKANASQHFKRDLYWSSETHPSDSDSAFCQYFSDGLQDNSRKDFKLRARAFRRLPI